MDKDQDRIFIPTAESGRYLDSMKKLVSDANKETGAFIMRGMLKKLEDAERARNYEVMYGDGESVPNGVFGIK